MTTIQISNKLQILNTNPTNKEKTNNSLNARELTDDEKIELTKITKTWDAFARNKAKQVSTSQKVFEDSISLCNYIISALNNNQAKYRFFICTQSQKNLDVEAIAVTSEKVSSAVKPYLYVEYLMTHPKNIRSTLNENEPHRVTGAATKIISHLTEVAQKANMSEIHLYSLNSARGFYQKNGFIDTGESNMVLTIKKEEKSFAPKISLLQRFFCCKTTG
jgi:hypothetical protein